jgi:hypothetical protein
MDYEFIAKTMNSYRPTENPILIFVSDRILSGLAKKLVQIPDSLDVLP